MQCLHVILPTAAGWYVPLAERFLCKACCSTTGWNENTFLAR